MENESEEEGEPKNIVISLLPLKLPQQMSSPLAPDISKGFNKMVFLEQTDLRLK